MADQRITDLTALTGANVADGDQFVLVDVSDTTMDATGTDKKITRAELRTAIAHLTATSQSGTTYTLVLADADTAIDFTNAAAVTVTVPPNSSVAFPLQTVVNIYAGGAAGVTIAAGAGVTIRNNTGGLSQYTEVSLRQRATDEWVRVG